MPYRHSPFITQEIYHVFNRSIAKLPIFKKNADYKRIIELIDFYRYQNLPLRFSHFKRLDEKNKSEFINNNILTRKPGLDILSYCIMPNHFHFLLKQTGNKAISDFMRNLQNSYSKYFNTKYERTGSLFQFMFKAIRIETDEQLLHVSRYIHLNPVSSYLIRIEDLKDYKWSSYRNYVSEDNTFVNTELIISFFKNSKDYETFTLKQADYQKELEKIKHLTLEE